MDPNTTLRVGVDVQSIAEVADSIAQFGSRYTSRLFTEHELESCAGDPARRAEGLAARFAAKEAMMKVLRPIDENVPSYKSIEVRKMPGGWVEIELRREAELLARAEGLTSVSLSMSHGGGVGMATVVASVADKPGNG
jgi:holo-[acyl-carrier protein] synthase